MKFDILITGACGMVGSHLLEKFQSEQPDLKVMGTYYNPTVDLNEIKTSATLVECDVRYANVLSNLIVSGLPAKIFHLAAQSYPVVSWAKPSETFDINCLGTVNVFEAIKLARLKNSSYDPVVVVACSSAQYGSSMKGEAVPEETAFLPLHPYGVSKVAQDLLAYQYFMSDQIKSVRARIFNTTGPRKKNDAISDFAMRLARIEKGYEKTLRVGNLQTRRAILDVADLMEALVLLSDKGEAGEAYNICNDEVFLMQDIVDLMIRELNVPVNYEIDPQLLRKTDEAVILGKNEKLKKATGWSPQVPIQQTAKRVLDYYRSKYA